MPIPMMTGASRLTAGTSRCSGARGRPSLALAVLAAGMLLALLGGCIPRAIGPRAVTIELMPDFRYEPREVVVRPGETVRLVLRNRDDRLPHEFRSAQRVAPDIRVEPGQAHELRWTAPPEPGAIAFWCGMPGHRKNGMAGRIVIRP